MAALEYIAQGEITHFYTRRERQKENLMPRITPSQYSGMFLKLWSGVNIVESKRAPMKNIVLRAVRRYEAALVIQRPVGRDGIRRSDEAYP